MKSFLHRHHHRSLAWLGALILLAHMPVSGASPEKAAAKAAKAAAAAAAQQVAAKTTPAPVNQTAPKTATPPANSGRYAGFENFAIIGERNIFNPNRVGRISRSVDAPPPASDTIALVGTMDYAKGLFAFFDGSQSSYRKALHVGGTIAKHTVTAIDAEGGALTRDGQKFSLKIGQQLVRPPGGEWSVANISAAQRAAETAATAQPTDAVAPITTIPADASETLRRLMEKRMNQLKQ